MQQKLWNKYDLFDELHDFETKTWILFQNEEFNSFQQLNFVPDFD